MNPTDYQFAVAELAAHALNHLDGWPEAEDEEGCCYHCCAPCHALYLMHTAKALDSTLRPFVAKYDRWAWWHNGGVDTGWLERGWRETAHHPNHGFVNGQRVGRSTRVPECY